MKTILIEPEIVAACPYTQVGAIAATVVNTPTSDELWGEIERAAATVAESLPLGEIKNRPAIAATRRLYRALGKDPGRYRVASEALCRRVVRGLGLYRLTTLIDVVNLVSLVSGYPISGLDADKISGDTLSMGVGREGEVYCGIGRGVLNIAGMPVYRDAEGGIATPTSDEERTKFTPSTTRVQINVNAFAPEMPLDKTVAWLVELLERYAQATSIETEIFHF